MTYEVRTGDIVCFFSTEKTDIDRYHRLYGGSMVSIEDNGKETWL